MSENKIIKVSNRDRGGVGYIIPESGVRRDFAVGETKNIPLDELKQLMYVPGGEFIVKNLLLVHDKEVLNEILNVETEPEYFYTEAEIKKLLLEGSIDQLKDCLEFAPEGVIEIIKKMAVEMKLPNTDKRQVISEMTGFNIDNAININKIMDASENKKEEKKETKRRTAPLETSENASPKRRTDLPTYNVVSKK